MICNHCGTEIMIEIGEEDSSHRRAKCPNEDCGMTWPWRQSEEDARKDVTPWLVRIGPLLRHSEVWYQGQRVRKIRALKFDAGLEDVSALSIEVVLLDGVTIEGADGTPVDLKRIDFRNIETVTEADEEIRELRERLRMLEAEPEDCDRCSKFGATTCPHAVPSEDNPPKGTCTEGPVTIAREGGE